MIQLALNIHIGTGGLSKPARKSCSRNLLVVYSYKGFYQGLENNKFIMLTYQPQWQCGNMIRLLYNYACGRFKEIPWE